MSLKQYIAGLMKKGAGDDNESNDHFQCGSPPKKRLCVSLDAHKERTISFEVLAEHFDNQRKADLYSYEMTSPASLCHEELPDSGQRGLRWKVVLLEEVPGPVVTEKGQGSRVKSRVVGGYLQARMYGPKGDDGSNWKCPQSKADFELKAKDGTWVSKKSITECWTRTLNSVGTSNFFDLEDKDFQKKFMHDGGAICCRVRFTLTCGIQGFYTPLQLRNREMLRNSSTWNVKLIAGKESEPVTLGAHACFLASLNSPLINKTIEVWRMSGGRSVLTVTLDLTQGATKALLDYLYIKDDFLIMQSKVIAAELLLFSNVHGSDILIPSCLASLNSPEKDETVCSEDETISRETARRLASASQDMERASMMSLKQRESLMEMLGPLPEEMQQDEGADTAGEGYGEEVVTGLSRSQKNTF